MSPPRPTIWPFEAWRWRMLKSRVAPWPPTHCGHCTVAASSFDAANSAERTAISSSRGRACHRCRADRHRDCSGTGGHSRWAAAPPLILAYSLFNAGFIFAAVKGGLQTKGGRLGAAAVSLNFAAMLLSNVAPVWTALSAGVAVTSLVAAYTLLKDAKAAAA
jgi:hypothetical protein